MEDKLVAEWHYDHLVGMLKDTEISVREKLRSAAEAKRKFIRKIKSDLKNGPIQWKLSQGSRSRNLIEVIENDLKLNAHPKVAERVVDLSEAHPFLIGAATADSLFHRKPDRLDYIQNGQFPFDNTYFELMEPLEETGLGKILNGNLCGVQLRKQKRKEQTDRGEDVTAYGISAYFDTREKGYAIVDFRVTVGSQKIKHGEIFIPQGRERLMLINCLDEEGAYSDKVVFGPFEEETLPFQRFVLTEDLIKKIREGIKYEGRTKTKPPFSPQDAQQGLIELNEFGINLINYVNAQNVHIQEHTRVVKRKRKRIGGGEITHEAEKPFHIIAVEDATVDVDERGNESGSLMWRVYVRGHNRKYRDETGEVYLVTWVRPYIRGPEDAPWRHHRYAVLAGMLKRERENIARYLPNKES